MKNTGPANPKNQNQESSAVVALRMEELTAWVIERVGKMPREHRYTIGDRLLEMCLVPWNVGICDCAMDL